MLFAIVCSLLPISTLLPYTTLFRSTHQMKAISLSRRALLWMTPAIGRCARKFSARCCRFMCTRIPISKPHSTSRSEEHTSELQSRGHLVCRLLLEKKHQTSQRHDTE